MTTTYTCGICNQALAPETVVDHLHTVHNDDSLDGVQVQMTSETTAIYWPAPPGQPPA